jgi:hypothetical protein
MPIRPHAPAMLRPTVGGRSSKNANQAGTFVCCSGRAVASVYFEAKIATFSLRSICAMASLVLR